MSSSSDRLECWKAWIKAHHTELEHIADFEAKFVLEIFSKIPEISPDDIIPQYPFYDRQKKLRRIDFLILNSKKGFALAIELDGYSKIKTYSDWEDLFVRQNALLESMNCLLLRYANRLWLNEPRRVIAEIREQLIKQANQKSQQDAQKGRTENLHIDQLISENKKVEQQILTLQSKLSEIKESIHSDSSASGEASQATNGKRQAKPFAVPLLIGAALVGLFALWILNEPHSLPQIQDALPLEPSKSDISAVSPPDVAGSIKKQDKARISSTEALSHIQENLVVCGKLAQIVDSHQYLFLNFDSDYPSNQFYGLIPEESLSNFKGINLYLHKNICISGTIQKYKTKAQILLKDQSQWIKE